MKMIICAKRNPAMTRPEFFYHLRHVHWPLVRKHERVACALDGYVQNHALGPDSPLPAATPYRIAVDRDSVIELFFDGDHGLQRLVETPEYLEFVRPDEARFNDLSQNIMIKTEPEMVFEANRAGRCKRFDFLVRSSDCRADEFRDQLTELAARLCLDPAYTAVVDRQVHNWPMVANEAANGQGFGIGSFDCVRELWSHSHDGLRQSLAFMDDTPFIDSERSFCVFATEFVMLEHLPSNDREQGA